MGKIAIRNEDIARIVKESLAHAKREIKYCTRELVQKERALRAANSLGEILPVLDDLCRKMEELRNKIQMQDQEADLIRGEIEVLAKKAGERDQI